MPTDRVHRLPQQARPRTIPPHRPQPSASDAATRPRHAHPDSEREAPHPIRRAAPVPSRRTRSVALHPIRRGVMPTDRVHRLPQQVQLRTVALRSHTPGLFHEGHARGTAPVPSRCTRSVALHPFRRATPVPSRRTRSVALHPIRRGVMPTDRVHRLPQQAQPRAIPPHRPQPSASVAATRPRHAHPDSEQETLHPLRRATPVTSRCTRYVAMHPIRRGVMPTDRVHCRPRQAQPRAITPHRPQPSVSDAATHPQNARQYSSAAIKETTRDREAHARHNATHRSTH